MTRLALDLYPGEQAPTAAGDYLVRERFQRFPFVAHFTPGRGFRHPATGAALRVATWAGPIPPLTTTKGD